MRAALAARQTGGINQAMATLNEASGDFARRMGPQYPSRADRP